MKNLNKSITKKMILLKINSITLLTLILCVLSVSTNAQLTSIKRATNSSTNSNFEGCKQVLKSKTGVVYSAAPGILEKRATSNSVTIKVKKTAGRAETQVNIYVNGNLKLNKKIEFDNGNYTTDYKTRVLNGVKGKLIKVEIVNQSVANTFSYKARIVGKRKTITNSGKAYTGFLIGQTKKTVNAKESCTGKVNVIVKRTSNKPAASTARGEIRVWEKVGSSWRKLGETKVLEKNQRKRLLTFNTNKKLKVELKNVSIGNTLEYKINVVTIQ